MEGSAETKVELRLGRVLGELVTIYRASWRDLLVLGLLIFVPIGLLESIGPTDAQIDDIDDLRLIPITLLVAAQIVIPLIGTVFYAGVVSAQVVTMRGGADHGIRELARELPYGRLIAADVLLVVLTGLGLALVIVPGFVILTLYALIAPIIEIEGTTVRASFRRSRELVRGNFWKVAGLVWPATLLSSALEALGDESAFEILGEGFPADWLSTVLGNLLAAPIWALIVVVLYLELRGDQRPRP